MKPAPITPPAPNSPDLEAIWRLVGSRITSFGMNVAGEIYLTTDRNAEFVIGLDEHKQICLYEIERKPL